MIITGTTTNILVEPKILNPTYNETIVVLESSNVIADNFKWIVDVWINGLPNASGAQLITTIEIFPNPDGYGIIDFHRIIENHITSTFYPADLDLTGLAVESFKRWSLDITEIFENPKWEFSDNDITLGPNVAFTTDKTIDSDYSDAKHPFVTGDIVSIQQYDPFTNTSYNTTTTLTVVDEYTVLTNIPIGTDGPIEPGLMTLVSGGTRTIEIIQSPTRATYVNFNGVIDWHKFNTWTPDEYDTSLPALAKPLTSASSVSTVDIDSNFWVNIFCPGTLIGGVWIQTNNGVYFTNVAYASFLPSNIIRQVKIGPKDLRDTTIVPYVAAGSLPMVDDNTTFIEYEFTTNSAPEYTNIRTIKYRLNVENNCSKYEKYNFLFLDKLGGYLPATFNLVSKKAKTNKKENYSKNYGTYDSVSNLWGYTTYDRGMVTYDMVTNETITVTSNWLNQNQNDFIQIMLTSPEVYHIDEDGVFRAINITTTSWEEKKRVNDKLINYTISFEYAVKNNNQRGW